MTNCSTINPAYPAHWTRPWRPFSGKLAAILRTALVAMLGIYMANKLPELKRFLAPRKKARIS